MMFAIRGWYDIIVARTRGLRGLFVDILRDCAVERDEECFRGRTVPSFGLGN